MNLPLDRLRHHLSKLEGPGTFVARRTGEAHDLALEVKGVGPLSFPLSREQTRALIGVARPARYGRGERTLLDPDVRDTWKVAKSRVRIDQRRWNRTLRPVLDGLREDLGLPAPARLRAELHSLLIYEPGQFFRPHQDTEKVDAMVGTLVVTLPSPYRGGALVVEHQGEARTFRRTKKPLSFVAFYADCRHEVRPVREGYRVSLTYNLMLETDEGARATLADPAEVGSLARALREYFQTPTPPRWRWGEMVEDPPDRLVFLLDHEYTERSLSWNRLKGNDAVRAGALREAAEVVDCEAALALAEVHEVWGAWPDEDRGPWYGRRGRWRDRDSGDRLGDNDTHPVDGTEGYTLQSLEDQDITLDRWLPPDRGRIEPISTSVRQHEVCTITPSVELEPYEASYTGFMGNWGNTMDRWYRRAAVVVWPRARAFAVRGEAAPVWALDRLRDRLSEGGVREARREARSLLPFWRTAAHRGPGGTLLRKALEVAEALGDAELAAALLDPFPREGLTPAAGPAFAALVGRYGEAWSRERLANWGRERRAGWGVPEEEGWSTTLPKLVAAVMDSDQDAGLVGARLLVSEQWRALRVRVEGCLQWESPGGRRNALKEVAQPLFGLLQATRMADAEDVWDNVTAFLLEGGRGELLPLVAGLLRLVDEEVATGREGVPGLEPLRNQVEEVLEERVGRPAREPGDWSIRPPTGCGCDLCRTLAEFLADPGRREMAWPLAKEKRKHIHRILDAHELPVLHRTRRSGRPFTLVLTKTDELFEREAEERERWKAELARLRGG